jgi:hypothetical protein
LVTEIDSEFGCYEVNAAALARIVLSSFCATLAVMPSGTASPQSWPLRADGRPHEDDTFKEMEAVIPL